MIKGLNEGLERRELAYRLPPFKATDKSEPLSSRLREFFDTLPKFHDAFEADIDRGGAALEIPGILITRASAAEKAYAEVEAAFERDFPWVPKMSKMPAAKGPGGRGAGGAVAGVAAHVDKAFKAEFERTFAKARQVAEILAQMQPMIDELRARPGIDEYLAQAGLKPIKEHKPAKLPKISADVKSIHV